MLKLKKMLKLNLQLFADEEGGEGEAMETTLPSFEEMYENGLPDDSQEESGVLENGENDLEHADEDAGNESIVQPWKNPENAQFAAQRRRQEEAQRIQQARDAVYRDMYAGQTNPYTGKPIQNEADYIAYQQQYVMEQMKHADVDPNIFQQAVAADPRVRQANAIIQQQQVLQAQQEQQQKIQQLQVALESIQKWDSDVKTFDDIINNPHFAEMDAMWQKGYRLEDAYFLANRAELEQKRQEATRQQVINQTTSKQHMRSTAQHGAGESVQIPADVMAMYREMQPDVTDAQIRKHYESLVKG